MADRGRVHLGILLHLDDSVGAATHPVRDSSLSIRGIIGCIAGSEFRCWRAVQLGTGSACRVDVGDSLPVLHANY